MRKPSPFKCLTPTLLALAASATCAAAPAVSTAPATAGASPAPVVTAPANPASSSTSTSSNSTSTMSGAGTASGTATSGETLRNESTSRSNQSAIGPTTDAASFGPDSPFVNNPNPEVGVSPGQTSSGIAAGNEPSGLENSTTTGTFTQNANTINGMAGTGVAAGTIVPADVIGSGGYAGGGGTAVGGTALAISPGLPASRGSATPLLDQATRNAAQREERRRADGNPPRIIGIAPRTDADRTDEMPDDPIIRY